MNLNRLPPFLPARIERWSGAFLCAGAVLLAAPQLAPAAPGLSSFAALPLSFEPAPADQNADPSSFVARGLNYQFSIAPAEAQLTLRKAASSRPASPLDRAPASSARSVATRAVRLSFVGANPQARLAGTQLLPGKINYLLGTDPAQWRVGTPTYGRVEIQQLYPGIDLVYYGNQQRLEYDFTLAPGADPAAIALRVDGVDRLSLSPEGDLVLGLGEDEIRQPRPIVYQVLNGKRQPIGGGYRLQDPHTVVFAPDAYDHTLPLTIDPTLTYSSYFGGNSDEIAWSVKVNPTDNSIYLAGQTLSSDFPFAWRTNFSGLTNHGGRFNGDGFVAKLDATGTNLLFFTYIGGEQDEAILDLALDSQGNAYITGYTSSTNFPVLPPAGIPGLPASTGLSGALTPARLFLSDAFVAELTNDGSALVFSAYLGGSDRDTGIGICLDSSNYVYVTGYTFSTNFPTTNAIVTTPLGTTNPVTYSHLSGSNDVFVTKFAPRGGGVIYSTYLGGTNADVGQGIAADANGFAFVTGYTSSTNFPVTSTLAPLLGHLNNTTNAAQRYDGVRYPPYDAFVAKIGPHGSNLVYNVFLGGTNDDSGFRIRLDPAGDPYVCGSTASPEYPIIPVLMTNLYNPGITNTSWLLSDAFVTKIVESNGAPAIQYSLHFGGTGADIAWDLAINPVTTNIFVVGSTFSTNFVSYLNANTNLPFLALTNLSRSNDVFVAAFAPVPFLVTTPIYVISNNVVIQTLYTTVTNSILTNLYSLTLGGLRDDYAFGVDTDPENNAYVVGWTASVNYPTLNPIQPNLAGLSDAFLTKIQTTDSVASVVVDTEPSGLRLVIDGHPVTAPYPTNWVYGSTHSIFAPPVQTNSPGVQSTWTGWSNGGAISNFVIPSVSSLHLVASFSTRYQLTTTAAGAGITSPTSGWFKPGTLVPVTAFPGAGMSFSGWTATGPGSSTSGNPALVTMNGPVVQTAHFTGTPLNQVIVITNGPGRVAQDYAGQDLLPGHSYTLTAIAAPDCAFAGWSGSLVSPYTSISFVMTTGLVFQANFTTNTFLATAGVYNGLFAPTNPVIYQDGSGSSGFFTATVSPAGSFSASMKMGKSAYNCSGLFTNGLFSTIIQRSSPQWPLQVYLVLDPTGPGRITGYLSGYNWTSLIEAERAGFSAAHPAPQGGRKYTVRIPGKPWSLVEPGGDGYLTLSVSPAGQVNVTSRLADGASFTQSAYLSALQQWPLYGAPYSSVGEIMGWLSFTNPVATPPGGNLFWYRPWHVGNRFYPGGFVVDSLAEGSLFAYTNGDPILNLPFGHIVIEAGGLGRNYTNTFTLQGSRFSVAPGPNHLTLSVNNSSGSFQGSFYDPNSRRTFPFYGALYPDQTNGSGYFVTTNQSGRVLIGP